MTMKDDNSVVTLYFRAKAAGIAEDSMEPGMSCLIVRVPAGNKEGQEVHCTDEMQGPPIAAREKFGFSDRDVVWSGFKSEMKLLRAVSPRL